jgi:hypothetical protein
MAKNLSFRELDAEHVELLPARTLVTALQIPGRTAGAGAAAVGAPNSGGLDRAPPCDDIPWWAPKPPGCQ